MEINVLFVFFTFANAEMKNSGDTEQKHVLDRSIDRRLSLARVRQILKQATARTSSSGEMGDRVSSSSNKRDTLLKRDYELIRRAIARACVGQRATWSREPRYKVTAVRRGSYQHGSSRINIRTD